MFEDADLIHAYSRADALRDGALIDVTPTAREAGFRWPVVLTRAAWERCVRVPPGVACQDEAGRLWGGPWLFGPARPPPGGGGVALPRPRPGAQPQRAPPPVRPEGRPRPRRPG